MTLDPSPRSPSGRCEQMRGCRQKLLPMMHQLGSLLWYEAHMKLPSRKSRFIFVSMFSGSILTCHSMWTSAIALVLAISLLYVLRRQSRTSNSPPGPKPLPLVGNLFDMPRRNPWETFSRWSNIYGQCR